MGNPQMGLTNSAPERNYLFEILPGDVSALSDARTGQNAWE